MSKRYRSFSPIFMITTSLLLKKNLIFMNQHSSYNYYVSANNCFMSLKTYTPTNHIIKRLVLHAEMYLKLLENLALLKILNYPNGETYYCTYSQK